jgi:hypothetical protein
MGVWGLHSVTSCPQGGPYLRSCSFIRELSFLSAFIKCQLYALFPPFFFYFFVFLYSFIHMCIYCLDHFSPLPPPSPPIPFPNFSLLACIHGRREFVVTIHAHFLFAQRHRWEGWWSIQNLLVPCCVTSGKCLCSSSIRWEADSRGMQELLGRCRWGAGHWMCRDPLHLGFCDPLTFSRRPLLCSPSTERKGIFFFVVLGFELRAYTLSHSSPFLWWFFFQR